MLFYNFQNREKFNILAYYPVAISKPKENKWSWLKWLRIPVELIANIAIGVATSGIGNAFASVALDFVLSSAFDLLSNLVFNNGKIDWKEYGISTAFNSVVFVGKFAKAFKVTKNSKTLNSVANNVIENGSEIRTLIKESTVSTQIFKNANNIVDEYGNIVSHYKVFDKANGELEKALLNLNKSSFRTTTAKSIEEYNRVSKLIRNIKSIFVKVRQVFSIATSPRYAGKKVIDLLLKKPKTFLTTQWNKLAKNTIMKISKKLGRASIDSFLKYIPIKSKWLDSIRIYKAYNPWDISSCNALLRFKKESTNNKTPVLLMNKRAKDIVSLINSPSPGRFYLNNFAYGWEIGKILRKFNNFLAISTIPIFANILSTIFFSYKTFNSIKKSLEENKWFWNQNIEYLGNEFSRGLKDNALKGWNFKYIKPLVSAGRSAMTGNMGYIMQSGLRTGSKVAWKSNFRKLRRKK